VSTDRKRYKTQWTAQFYAAAELTRRDYLVSFTFGNAPVIDLLVVSPQGEHFMVDVKGLSSKNFWLVQEHEPQDDLFYILVHLPSDSQPPNFYILTSRDMMKEINALKKQTVDAGKTWTGSGAGINWGTALDYKDRWDSFPA
jgi:hypothetical protein